MRNRLVLQGITQTFEDGGSKRTILDMLHLEVAEGELVAVMGPSGSGKVHSCPLLEHFLNQRKDRFFWTGLLLRAKANKIYPMYGFSNSVLSFKVPTSFRI